MLEYDDSLPAPDEHLCGFDAHTDSNSITKDIQKDEWKTVKTRTHQKTFHIGF